MQRTLLSFSYPYINIKQLFAYCWTFPIIFSITSIAACDLSPVHQESQTDGLLLEGGHTWTPTMFIRLVQDFGLESEVAKHLAHTYGDRAFSVAKLASLTGKRWPIGSYTFFYYVVLKFSEHICRNILKIPMTYNKDNKYTWKKQLL